MSLVRKHSRARRVLGVLGKIVGVSFVFVSATAAGAVLHLDAPAARRLVATQVSGILKSTFAGEVHIERIGHVGLDGIDGVNVHIRDPDGIDVLHADGIRVRIEGIKAARSALFGKGPIVVSVPAASIEHVEANVDGNAANELRLAATFAPKTPSPPEDPNAPPGRGVIVEAPLVRVGHAWVHGTPPGAPLVDAEVSALLGRAHVDPSIVVRAELERASLVTRGLPRGADPSGTATGRFLMPAANGKGFDVQALFDGAAFGIPTTIEARLDDQRLDARIDARDAAGARTSTVAELAVRDPIVFHAEAHGNLPHVEGKAKLAVGKATLDAGAVVDAGPSTRVRATVAARDVDVSAIVDGAPVTDLGLDAVADVVIAGSQIRGTASVDTLPGTVDRQRVPLISARAKGEDDRYELRARIVDDAMPTEIAIDVVPRGGPPDARTVNASLRSRMPDLHRLPVIGSQAGGSARVVASARVLLPEQTIEDGRADVVLDRASSQGLSLARAEVKARANGSVEHAKIDGEVHVREIAGLPLALSSVDARARVDVAGDRIVVDAPHIEAARNLIYRVSASARRVRVEKGRLAVEEAEVLGLGDPIHASFAKSAAELRGSIDAPKIDLPLVARIAGKENDIDIKKGTFGISGEGSLRGGVAKAKMRAEVRDLSIQNVSGGTATVDASIDDRNVGLALDANVGRVGAIALRTSDVTIDGRVDDPKAWKRSRGKVQLEGHVDLLRAALLAPRGSLPVTDLRGELSVQGRVGRDGPDAPPEVSLHAHTNGLLVAGRSGPPERVGAITVEPPSPWRSADVDLGLDVRNDGTSGLTMVAFRATDEHGVVAAVDAKTVLPYEKLMTSDAATSRAQLMDAPMSLTVVVPSRRLDQLPAFAGVSNIQGMVDAKLDVTGSVHAPNIQLAAHGRGVHTPEMPPDLRTDADVALAYDGHVANLSAKVGSKGQELLELASRVEIAVSDLLERSEGEASKELPWAASGRVKLASFPLESVPQIAARQARGRVSGEVTLEGLHRDAKLAGRLDLDELAVGKAEYTRGFVTVDAGGGKLAAKVRLEQKDGFLDGGVSTGLGWGAQLAPALDDKEPLVASLDAKAFRAAAIQPFVESTLPMLDGRIDANVRAQITPGKPGAEMQGGITLRDGTVQVAALGEELRAMRASVRFSPDGMIRVTDVYARGTQGEVGADAQVQIDGMRVADATAHVRIPERRALTLAVQGQPIGQVAGQINVKASQSKDSKSTSVTVDIPKLGVELPQVTKSGVQSLDENEHIHVGVYRGSRDPARSGRRRPQEATLPAAQVNGRRFVTLPFDEQDLEPEGEKAADGSRLDVDVRLGQIEIERGNMLRVALTGNPKVSIENGETKLNGQIRVQRGWIDVQGKRFTVESGTVTFNGESPPNPVVVATAGWNAADGTRIYADFTGPVKTGKVTLRSEPPRPQNEIFALVLFGTADGANPQRPPPGKQASGTASAAVGLGGGYVAQGLTEALDDLAGIQATARIDSTRASNPRPEVEIAISSKVSIGFAHVLGTPPITEPDKNLANVDYRFHRNWSLEATYGDRGTTLLDAIWQRRY